VNTSGIIRCVSQVALILATCVSSSAQNLVVEEVYGFEALTNSEHGSSPYAGLLLASNGDLYGTTHDGGMLGFNQAYGTVFRVSTNGVLTTLAVFDGTNGGGPTARLTEGVDGNLYGTTWSNIFRITHSGELTNLGSIPDGVFPTAALVQADDGSFYGTTSGVFDVVAMVFRMTPDYQITTINSIGTRPSTLIQADDGNFYGTSADDMFRMTRSGELTTLFPPLRSSYSGVLQAKDGGLYGVGSDDKRTIVFRMTTRGELTVVGEWPDSDELRYGTSELIQATDGNIYGVADAGGVFQITLDGVVTALIAFSETNANLGYIPIGGLAQGPDGNLYGVNYRGGSRGGGNIYRIRTHPAVANQPTNQFVSAGASASLTVEVTGVPLLRYQWFLNDIPLVGGTSRTFELRNANLTNAGIYHVAITNGFGAVTSSPALLTVCDFVFGSPFARFGTNGGSTNVSVSVSSGCPWSINNTNSWITVTNGSGEGDGSFSYSVEPNPGLPRLGFLTISNKVHAVAQAGVFPPGRFDFTGDHLADVLFQRTDGTLAAWAMNGTNFLRGVLLRKGIAPSAAWRVFGQGDFNGDGKTDVAFQNKTTGKLAVWFMDGTNFLGAAFLRNGIAPAASWHAVSAADFNGDGKPDILFQNYNRTSAVWLMDGINFTSAVSLHNGIAAGSGWKIVGAGDFNGYGQTDIVWQHIDGRVAAWQFVGTTFVGTVLLRNGPAASTGWRIRGVSDFTGDGKTDLLLVNADGRTVIWIFDRTTFVGSMPLRNFGNGWQLVGPK
jgi:uncharacterized repeat protein (TIGR03803 family)